VQATVREFDPAARSGTVFCDDGTVVAFGPGAFAASGLRLLRPGQRVTIGRDGDGAITTLALAGFPLPGPRAAANSPRPPTCDRRSPMEPFTTHTGRAR
jgi:redox-sensitive bicupin YhaK (pirin superfamily)